MSFHRSLHTYRWRSIERCAHSYHHSWQRIARSSVNPISASTIYVTIPYLHFSISSPEENYKFRVIETLWNMEIKKYKWKSEKKRLDVSFIIYQRCEIILCQRILRDCNSLFIYSVIIVLISDRNLTYYNCFEKHAIVNELLTRFHVLISLYFIYGN